MALFGTDGIRGQANIEPMTPQTILQVALATSLKLRRGDHRHRVVIGKDTRLSGYMLEPALTAGFVAMGMDVRLVGPLPTPAVAMLTRSMRADLGVMISASHNPYQDNGLKLFGPDGYKLSVEMQQDIENRMKHSFNPDLADAKDLGRVVRLDDARGRYIEYVKNTFPKGLRLEGLKIVIDCANGAAYNVAPNVLEELGAEIIPLSIDPDGTNINEKCGAMSPLCMREQVVAHGADIGIALDGDADRLVMADEHGKQIDGDQLMALIATAWHKAGQLKKPAIVTTIMSNLGLEKFLETKGLILHRTQVGDRHVVKEMRAQDINVGGEQSGHIILGDYSTTGDGLIAALQILAVLQQSGKPASEVLTLFEPFPQKLKNIAYKGANPLDCKQVQAVVKDNEARLGDKGRIVVRVSGTEPLVRVMVEGEDEQRVDSIIDEICTAVKQVAG